jgi:hypothetical protein
MKATQFLQEASLTNAELRKYAGNRLEVFISKIQTGSPFVKVGETEPSIVLVNDVDVIERLQKNDIPVMFDIEEGGSIRLTQLQKTKEFGGMGSKKETSEKQEHGLIDIINNNPGCMISKMDIIAQSASSNEGTNSMKKERYIDIFITDSKGKDHGISMKGTVAPSLGGGGAAGINSVAPDLFKKIFKRIEHFMKNELKLANGDIISINHMPDIFVRVPDDYVESIMMGNEAMGGPIDYMYVGPMDATGEVDKNNMLNLNGQFYTIEEYINKIGNFYFRIRKRDLDAESKTTQVAYDENNSLGFPKLLKNPVTNANNLRLVVTYSATVNGIVLEL